MRRVNCRRCGIVAVEEVPWGDGKPTLTKAYMLFLARWARRLSWKETADAFRTSWDKVFDAVEHVVALKHGTKAVGMPIVRSSGKSWARPETRNLRPRFVEPSTPVSAVNRSSKTS